MPIDSLLGGSPIMMFRLLVCLMCAALALADGRGLGQEPAPVENKELAELLAAAREYDIRVASADTPLKLHEPAVLNFTNPERNQELGSVFVWMQEGRPATFKKVYNSFHPAPP